MPSRFSEIPIRCWIFSKHNNGLRQAPWTDARCRWRVIFDVLFQKILLKNQEFNTEIVARHVIVEVRLSKSEIRRASLSSSGFAGRDAPHSERCLERRSSFRLGKPVVDSR